MEGVKEEFKELAKDPDDEILCALYPITGKLFLKWKYGLAEVPPEAKPKTMKEVQKEQDLVKKALSGELSMTKKGAGREIEVKVDGEAFTVEINDPHMNGDTPHFRSGFAAGYLNPRRR